MKTRTFLFMVFLITFLQAVLVFGQNKDNWKRLDADDRRFVVNRMTDQILLAKIAKDDDHSKVRIAAVEKLTDQSVLSEIANDDVDPTVRTAAVARITDQSFLRTISLNLNPKNNIARSLAMFGMTSESYLIDVIKKNISPDSVYAIRFLNNQDILTEIAKDNSNYMPDVRAIAVKKINDQNIVEAIARKDGEIRVREAAISNLDNQMALAEIALNDSNHYARTAAAERLTDQTTLKKIIQSDTDVLVRTAATRGLDNKDQTLLIDILKNDSAWKVRIAAVHKIIDQTALEEIARNDQNMDVRISALRGIVDKNVLLEIINDKTLPEIHYWAAYALQDIEILADLAKNHMDASFQSKLKSMPVITISGVLLNEKGWALNGMKVFLIPLKKNSTVLKLKDGKVINKNDSSDYLGRFSIDVSLDLFQSYEEFTLGYVIQKKNREGRRPREGGWQIVQSEEIRRLHTKDGIPVKLSFEGTAFQNVDLGKITVTTLK